MIFTTKAEYGVRLLVELGRQGSGQPVSLKAISEAEGLPLAYLERIVALLKKAAAYTEDPEGGIAVIIARHPCIIAYRDQAIPERKHIIITDDCEECNLCIDRFECPALYHDEKLGRTEIDQALCSGCGVCLAICPKGAIVEAG